MWQTNSHLQIALLFHIPSVDCIFLQIFPKQKIKQTIATMKRGEKCVNGIQFISNPVLHLYKYTRVLFVDLGLEMQVGFLENIVVSSCNQRKKGNLYKRKQILSLKHFVSTFCH